MNQNRVLTKIIKPMEKTVISRISALLQAIENCRQSNNIEWLGKHSDVLDNIEKDKLPHGSGIDSGCTIDREKSNSKKIIINVPFHNMDENGFYCGWSDFKVILTPSFDGFNIRITGKDKYYVKDYLYDLFDTVLNDSINY